MADFLVKVADERGHVREQHESGMSATEVRDRYAQQGYLVYWVKPRGVMAGGEVRLPQRRKVKLDEFVIFNQQFVTLIRAGLPIAQALDLLTRRQRNPYFRSILENVRDRVKSGELLSDAFDAQGTFPKVYTTTLLAGEKSGNLEEVLGRYIGFQRLAVSFRKRLAVALIYPAILVCGVCVLLTLLFTFVVPRFAVLYQDLNIQLPAITLFTLAVGQAIKKYALVIFGVGIAAAVFFAKWKKTERGSVVVDRIKLGIPKIGTIWLKYQIAVFSRMMSTLLQGGLPLVPALDTAGASMASVLMKKGIIGATQKVREGRTLSSSIEQSKVFPELAVEMVEVGESTGALPAMLASVAEFYEEDVQTSLTGAMSLIEPAILIFMAVIVGFVLISLYLPVFSVGVGR